MAVRPRGVLVYLWGGCGHAVAVGWTNSWGSYGADVGMARLWGRGRFRSWLWGRQGHAVAMGWGDTVWLWGRKADDVAMRRGGTV